MSLLTAGSTEVTIPVQSALEERMDGLRGTLSLPRNPTAIVVFAHGAGSSRLSPRNVAVADTIRSSGTIGTLLFDLLTPEEDEDYARRFDIELLTRRLLDATEWLKGRDSTRDLHVGYFGASTGAAAALRAAAELVGQVRAVVSRGGRPDLAEQALPSVKAPTLLIVGGHDPVVIEMNRQAFNMLRVPKDLAVVPGATHLFEEPGALEQVAALATRWFERYLPQPVHAEETPWR